MLLDWLFSADTLTRLSKWHRVYNGIKAVTDAMGGLRKDVGRIHARLDAIEVAMAARGISIVHVDANETENEEEKKP